MKPLLYILSIFFLLTSCKEDKKDQFARLVQEWQGKEIVFPQDMAFTRFVTEQAVSYTHLTLPTILLV